MVHFSYELNDPKFIDYEFSLYREPLSYLQEVFFHDFTYWLYKEEVDDITSRPWTEAGLTEQAYEGVQLSHNGVGNWPAMLESYFGCCWVEDQFSCCYGTLDNGLENIEDAQQGEEQWESNYSYDDDDAEVQPAYETTSWSGYGGEEDCHDYGAYETTSWSGYGGEEDCHDYGAEEPTPAYGFSSDEMRLCESIFGP